MPAARPLSRAVAAAYRLVRLWPLARRLALAFGAVAIGCAALPLCGMLGYESALVFGVLGGACAPWVGLSAARRFARVGTQAQALGGALAICWAAPCALLFAWGRVHGHCNDAVGLVFWLLLPAPSMAFGGACGLWIGQCDALAATRRRRALSGTAYLACSLFGVAMRLYKEPSVRVFDHALGYFAGSLYDEDVAVVSALLWFRAVTILQVALLAGLLFVAARAARPSRPHTRLVFTLAVFVCFGFFDTMVGPWLGFRTTQARLRQALPVTRTLPGLVIHLPSHTDPRVADAIEADHAVVWQALRQRVPQRDGPPVHSFVFASARDKAHWLGLANTEFCNTWRREVYLQGLLAPHPQLAHELSHAALSVWAPGPWHLPAYGRVWPHVALIEGAATAIAPNEEQSDVWQSARRMRAVGLGAALPALFSAKPWRSMRAFWGEAPARVYAQAGAFCDWFVRQFGMAIFLDAYADGDLARASGQPLPDLVRHFDQALQQGEPIGETDKKRVLGKMRHTSVFARRCPHEAARLWRMAGDVEGQRRCDVLQQWLMLAPHSAERACAVAQAIRQQQRHAALSDHTVAWVDRLESWLRQQDHELPVVRARILLHLAGQSLFCGDTAQAALDLTALQALPLEPAQRREFCFLRWASTLMPHPQRVVLRALFDVSDPLLLDDTRALAHAQPAKGEAAAMAWLLVARLHLQRHEYEKAALAMQQGGPLAVFGLEQERLVALGQSLWLAGRIDAAQRHLAQAMATGLNADTERQLRALHARVSTQTKL